MEGENFSLAKSSFFFAPVFNFSFCLWVLLFFKPQAVSLIKKVCRYLTKASVNRPVLFSQPLRQYEGPCFSRSIQAASKHSTSFSRLCPAGEDKL